jgi:hypothetical protein
VQVSAVGVRVVGCYVNIAIVCVVVGGGCHVHVSAIRAGILSSPGRDSRHIQVCPICARVVRGDVDVLVSLARMAGRYSGNIEIGGG